MIKICNFIGVIFCFSVLPWSSARNLNDIFQPYQEGPGEGCYSVCLSKEIKLLHEEIKAISPPETGSQIIPGLQRLEKKTVENSGKLDKLLKAVENIEIGGDSSEDIETLKKQLKEANALIVALNEEKSKLIQKATKTSEEIRTLQENVAALEASLTSKDEECKNTLGQLKEQVTHLQDQQGKFMEKIAKLALEKQALRKQLETAINTIEKLRRDLAEGRRVVEEARHRVGNLTANLAEEKKKLQEREEQVKNLKKELAQEKSKVSANEKLVDELTESLKDVQDEVKLAKGQVGALTEELEEERKKLAVAEAKVKDLEKRLKEELEKENQCQASLKKLEANLNKEKEKTTQCYEDLANAKKSLAEEETKVQSVGDQLTKCENAKRDAENAVEAMKKSVDELKKRNASLAKELTSCKKTTEEWTEKIAMLHETMQAKQAELDKSLEENEKLRGENGKKAQEIEKLKKDLKDALNDQVAGEELKKVKAENAQLKKQNQKAIDKITKLEEEIAILNKGHQSEPVKFDDALFGASSQAPFCEADNAFTQDHYASWTSDQDAPQSIWVQFKKAKRVTRMSFKSSIAPKNGASKFELMATNDATCNADSKWDIIYEDLSGRGFISEDDTTIAEVDSCKMYKCYGIRVLDVNNEGEKWVIMSEIKLWARN